jgi:CHAD domain-containing protein
MSSGRDAFRRYLVEQAERVSTESVAVASGGSGSVHDLRVSIRRVRSALRTFAPLLPAEESLELDLRLKQTAAALGPVRDLEVLEELLNGQPPGTVRDRERRAVRAALARHQRVLRADLSSARHRRLVADLLQFTASVDTGHDRLRPLAKDAARKARRRLARAGQDPTALHRARVAAKRARYAAEIVGKSGRARRLKRVSAGLGCHHDCHVAAALLRSLDVTGADAEERDRILADLDAQAERGLLSIPRSW